MPKVMQAKSALKSSLLVVTLYCSFLAQHTDAADPVIRRCQDEVCCCTQNSKSAGWTVLESTNFRMHHVGQNDVAQQLIRSFEQQRWTLQKKWLSAPKQTAWTPKCDVYCYPTGRDYARLTNYPADSWGHVDLEIGSGSVWRRRLNLRSDIVSQLTVVAAHELTHVVLADVFCMKQIPRWADEGIAIQSEPAGRRGELRQKLATSMTQGRHFSFQELTSAANYPQDPLLTELFYAQSGAWIEFLTVQKKLSGQQLLQLIAGIPEKGLRPTLREHFPNATLANLESDWNDWMLVQPLLAESPSISP